MSVRVNIEPQWRKLAARYWDSFSEPGKGVTVNMSIWEMLELEYGAKKVRYGVFGGKLGKKKEMVVDFPNELAYTAFLLKYT
jgi:hypothetical protein